MKNKIFDSVELQRKIRDKFWEESGGNIRKLNKIIDLELQKNELYKFLLERKEKSTMSK